MPCSALVTLVLLILTYKHAMFPELPDPTIYTGINGGEIICTSNSLTPVSRAVQRNPIQLEYASV